MLAFRNLCSQRRRCLGWEELQALSLRPQAARAHAQPQAACAQFTQESTTAELQLIDFHGAVQ